MTESEVTEIAVPVKARMTEAERDAKLGAIMSQIEALLYEARDAHSLGAASVVPFFSLPKAWRQDIINAASATVMHESLKARQDAELAARAYLVRWMKAEAITALDTVTVLEPDRPRDRYIVQAALDRFIRTLTDGAGPNVVTEVLLSYQQALIGGVK